MSDIALCILQTRSRSIRELISSQIKWRELEEHHALRSSANSLTFIFGSKETVITEVLEHSPSCTPQYASATPKSKYMLVVVEDVDDDFRASIDAPTTTLAESVPGESAVKALEYFQRDVENKLTEGIKKLLEKSIQ